MGTEIGINPTILTWAIARAGFVVEEFLEKYPRVKEWVLQIKRPTVKQLEEFARRVYIPFGYLFLNEPPKEDIPFPFFRTGANHTNQVSINVYDSILILQRRQDWLTDYLLENDEKPLSFVGKFSMDSSFQNIVDDIRKVLNVSPDWAYDFKTIEETVNYIANKIEEVRIMVNFNGVVENNTKRVISVEECRGFVLVNNMVPFMFVNAADAKAAQLFTIIHELAHIWIGASAGFNNVNLLPASDPTERLCDQVAAEFLVPAESFDVCWRNHPDINKIAKMFKVSPIVIARRALDLGKISKAEFFQFYNQYMDNLRLRKEAQGPGGDFYATARKRVSVSFGAYVDQAVKQNKLLYRDAYRLTGLRGNTYQNFVNNHLY